MRKTCNRCAVSCSKWEGSSVHALLIAITFIISRFDSIWFFPGRRRRIMMINIFSLALKRSTVEATEKWCGKWLPTLHYQFEFVVGLGGYRSLHNIRLKSFHLLRTCVCLLFIFIFISFRLCAGGQTQISTFHSLRSVIYFNWQCNEWGSHSLCFCCDNYKQFHVTFNWNSGAAMYVPVFR